MRPRFLHRPIRPFGIWLPSPLQLLSLLAFALFVSFTWNTLSFPLLVNPTHLISQDSASVWLPFGGLFWLVNYLVSPPCFPLSTLSGHFCFAYPHSPLNSKLFEAGGHSLWLGLHSQYRKSSNNCQVNKTVEDALDISLLLKILPLFPCSNIQLSLSMGSVPVGRPF